MTSKNIDSQNRTPARIALHTLGGVLLGLLVATIPFSIACESTSGLQATHIIAAFGFVALLGTLSAIGGDKILDRLAEMATNLSL